MVKTNQNIKNKIHHIVNTLVVILIILLNKTNIVYGANINWIEVSKTPAGIQYLDRENIHIKENGIIEITTKYLKIDTSTSKEIEQNIYVMNINCLANKFKIFQLMVKRI
tara:strand:- start:171 stop:500 length:330 start_codon:yes stop_codon:yes gene_type:complete